MPNTKKKTGREKAAGLLEMQSKLFEKRRKSATWKSASPDPRKAREAFIRELLIFHTWTQEQLLSRLQSEGFRRCSRSLISQIEVGAACIRGEEIYYFREVFGMSFDKEFWKPYHKRKSEPNQEGEVS